MAVVARRRRSDEAALTLRREIETGLFHDAEALPGERQLAGSLGVSRTTLRQALADLIGAGLLVQRPGLGTFIVRNGAPPPPGVVEPVFNTGMENQTIGARELERGMFAAFPDEALALGLSASEPVCRQVRVLFRDAGPVAVERAAAPARLLPDPGWSASSLLDALAGRGARAVRKVHRLRSAALSAGEAAQLETGHGAPALEWQEAAFLAEGRCCAFTRAVYRVDRVDALFVSDLGGTASAS